MLETDQSLTKQMADIVRHPIRCKCLAILTERTASPVEVAREVGESVTDTAYHIRVLFDFGVVEAVDSKQVRGAVEHFYRAIQRPELDDEGYRRLSIEDRVSFGRTICQLAFADLGMSMEAGVFGERHDHHAIRFPVTVDEEGWRELQEIYGHALQEVYEVTKRTAERQQNSPDGTQRIQARVAAFVFEMPPGPGAQDQAAVTPGTSATKPA